MKREIILLAAFSISVFISAQEIAEKEIQTKADEVIVFIEGAQITSKKTIELEKGTVVLKFTDLSPFIDPKSIRVKSNGNLSVLSVNHQLNYQHKQEQSKTIEELNIKIAEINEKIQTEQLFLGIISEELKFLQDNKSIKGENLELNINTLKEATSFYHDRLTTLKLQEIERFKKINLLSTGRDDVLKQINKLTAKKEYPSSGILVKIDAKTQTSANFELSYLVSNAGWFPSYDIRAKSIQEPVEIVYKANVHQDTKVDWKNAKLTFSSSNPNRTGSAPDLKTYLLNYYTQPPTYDVIKNNLVSGQIVGALDGGPLPGVNVVVAGTTIGTVTDINGNYSISIPNNATLLDFSYIGYANQRIPITGNSINISMQEELMALDEVVVIGYGTEKKSELTGAVSSVSSDDLNFALQGRSAGLNIKTKPVFSVPLPVRQVENQTTFEFQIDFPYTINSNNQNYIIEMESYSVPADYIYYCVPKIDRDAFLIAHITDWEKYNLMEGEASIFFEDTYIGKSVLDVRYAEDTLTVSLGRDKNLQVKREKVKQLSTKQFIGNKKEETRDWIISVKNNKKEPVKMILTDQVPVSTLQEIEVEIQKSDGAVTDKETGKITWNIELDSYNSKDYELKYTVKYPKYRNLVIE